MVNGGCCLKLLVVAGEANVIVAIALIASPILDEATCNAGKNGGRATNLG